MGHTHSRNSVHLAIKTTAVSMVILLAAGCSDSDSLPSTTDNQHNTAPEVSNEAPKGDDTTKIPEDAGNNSPSGGIGGGNTDVDSGKDTGVRVGRKEVIRRVTQTQALVLREALTAGQKAMTILTAA